MSNQNIQRRRGGIKVMNNKSGIPRIMHECDGDVKIYTVEEWNAKLAADAKEAKAPKKEEKKAEKDSPVESKDTKDLGAVAPKPKAPKKASKPTAK